MHGRRRGTERLLIGTGICLVIERDPIVTAKEVASVDVLSGGRFLFGVGAGWNVEEMANHGTDASHRFGLMRERIEAMKAIWSQDEASYSGRYVNFERIWCWPKPVQKPHPPVIVGGNGAKVLDRVLASATSGCPTGCRTRPRGEGRFAIGARFGDRPGSDPVTVVGFPADAARIEAIARIGVDRVVLASTGEPGRGGGGVRPVRGGRSMSSAGRPERSLLL